MALGREGLGSLHRFQDAETQRLWEPSIRSWNRMRTFGGKQVKSMKFVNRTLLVFVSGFDLDIKGHTGGSSVRGTWELSGLFL